MEKVTLRAGTSGLRSCLRFAVTALTRRELDYAVGLVVKLGQVRAFGPGREGPLQPVRVVALGEVLAVVAAPALGPLLGAVGDGEGEADHAGQAQGRRHLRVCADAVRPKAEALGPLLDLL